MWQARREDDGTHTGPEGRVIEMLSEHQCQGWLEGYLLTGRHGLFTSYEAFIHLIDSMFNQHAKWLKVSRELPWRRPVASLNYLLSQPRVAPGPQRLLSHQDPGFIDHVVNKKAEVVRVYLPPDANTLLSARTTTACARATTSTWWSRASSRRRRGSPWTRRSTTARAASASGTSRPTCRPARSPTW